MKLLKVSAAAAALSICSFASAQQTYKVKLVQPEHGVVTVTPAIPADNKVKAGTVLNVKVEVTDPGWVFDSGYYLSIDNGMSYPVYKESMAQEFKFTVNTDILGIGASIIEAERLNGYKTIQDVVYAQPGAKKLKYDMFIPDGAENLPCIVIIHGGGWSSNTEDIMRGLARELIKGGKYCVASIDYRFVGKTDGDFTPNKMNQLIEDCYGAILHIQEHASDYGINPNKIAVTGDSAGGHLSASVATMIERIGDRGFGKTSGVYEYLPTYMPKGMNVKQAKQSLKAIKAAAPSYGAFDTATVKRFAQDMPQEALEALSPLYNVQYAKNRAIPHFLVLGTLDRTVGRGQVEAYVQTLKNGDQKVTYHLIEGASHAFFDWKPDQGTKDTFAKYGVPYAAEMQQFFDEVFY